MLVVTLALHRLKPRVSIGCMKSGPVLAQKNVKYHEPEYWKFGEEGNRYFLHATGHIYAITRELATYISVNHACQFCTSMQMKMCRLVLGLLDLKLNTSMNATCSVGRPQVRVLNNKLKKEAKESGEEYKVTKYDA
ncbi:hypothetical protein AAC387_Pa01g2316 [Persea americana]